MLIIRLKKISMQFIVLVNLCMCCSFVMYLSIPSAFAVPPPPQPYYVVDAYQAPGLVYRIINREPSVFFKRPSGSISGIALWGEQLFFSSSNDKKIYLRTGQQERVVFEHHTYIRDIVIDPDGYLYFSEASDAKGDGRIYKLNPPVYKLGFGDFSRQSSRPFYSVYLKTVEGFWAGDFTFDSEGNLYICNGNRIPAFVYRAQREKDGQYGPLQKKYKDTQVAIKGIAVDPSNPNFAYYTDWKQTIYRLDIRNLKRSVEFSGNLSGSRSPHLSDVTFDVRIRRR